VKQPSTNPNPEPFPHIVWHDLFPTETLTAARAEFDQVPAAAWSTYDNSHERKAGATFNWGGPNVQAVGSMLQHPSFIGLLSATFDIPALTYSDLGGGMHRIKPGGYLDVHVDFNRHDDGRYRRINVLVYLNDDPDPSGDLWLCDGWPNREPPVRVPARLGTVAAFATSEHSWHGHPLPLQGHDERRSLAAYYYTAEAPPGVAEPHSTIYKETA
jgi:Rps23 Pro-64 3,4-dihydroxylase Tpa1-like proline 4-hydroxylase